MSIKNAVSKTIAYAKRNGVKAAFFAAVERVGDNRRENYNYVPLSDAVIAEQKKEYKLLAESGDIVRFSIVVPLYNTPEKYLREMIESVIAQTYGNWELVLADASKEPLDAAKEFAAKDPRICYYHLDSNEGISENTNCGLKKATGDYIGLLDHDDVLTPDALYEVDRVIRKSMKTNKLARFASCPVRLIYSDEDKYDDASGRYYEHHEKPSFNMDYLMSNNYRTVKIDKSLLWKATDKAGMDFLMITVNQLKSIKLQVLQEGVETKEQLDIITAFGGNLIQGYYFSKPLPDSEFIAYCKRLAG